MTRTSQAVKQASKEAKKHSNVSVKVKNLQHNKAQDRGVSLTAKFPFLLRIQDYREYENLERYFKEIFNSKKIKSFHIGNDIEGVHIVCFYIVKNKPTKKELDVLLKQKNYKIWDDEDDDYDEDVYPIEKDIEYDEDEDDLDEY